MQICINYFVKSVIFNCTISEPFVLNYIYFCIYLCISTFIYLFISAFIHLVIIKLFIVLHNVQDRGLHMIVAY